MVLSAHSPVFDAMLYGKMKESEPNSTIKIPDVRCDGFSAMLKFVYCNNPELNEENVMAVRHVADKYQISPLIELCDIYVSKNINVTNACLILDPTVE